MASVTPAVGEIGCLPILPDEPTTRQNRYSGPPLVERIGPVRIFRGGAAWRGVALRLAPGEPEGGRFEIALTAGDGRSLTVAIMDAEDAVAVWRDAGRASGLPLLLETGDGTVSEPYPQLGRLMLGPVRIRRRYAFLNGRRPRFLTRRKTGKMPARPAVVGGVALSDQPER